MREQHLVYVTRLVDEIFIELSVGMDSSLDPIGGLEFVKRLCKRTHFRLELASYLRSSLGNL